MSEGAVFREEAFSFRFIQLAIGTAERVREQLGNFKQEFRRPDVVSLAIDETSNLELLYAFLEQESLPSGTYSVWISLLTSSDHGGVSLPDYILELVRRTRVGVDFSFVACLDDVSP